MKIFVGVILKEDIFDMHMFQQVQNYATLLFCMSEIL